MRRLAILAASFAVALALIVDGTVRHYWDDAVAAGRKLYVHRPLVLADLDRQGPPGRAPVVWFGDSTIMTRQLGGSYPVKLGKRLPGIESRVVAQPGLGAFGYYFLMDRALEQHPRAVVLIANPHLLGADAGRNVNDLAALLPAGELARAALLPMHGQGWNVARLLLVRLWRFEWAENAMYFLEGLRQLWQGAAAWELVVPADPPRRPAPLRYLRRLVENLRAYDRPIGETSPAAQLLGAAVRMATARGVPVLVVVTPIPWETLQREGLYDARSYVTRIAALDRVVTANGGRLVDLHRELVGAELRDLGGHFNDEGTEHLSRVLAPVVLEMLRRSSSSSSSS